MTARQTDTARAMSDAIRRAVFGGTVHTTPWARPDEVASTVAADGRNDPVMTTDGDLYFLADYSEADGQDITG